MYLDSDANSSVDLASKEADVSMRLESALLQTAKIKEGADCWHIYRELSACYVCKLSLQLKEYS